MDMSARKPDAPESHPRNTPEFLLFLLRAVPGNLRNTWKKKLVLFSVFFILILFLHTFLVACINQSIYYHADNAFTAIINISTHPNLAWSALPGSALAVWPLAVLFLSTLLHRVADRGLRAFLTDLWQAPLWFSQLFLSTGRRGLMTLLLSIALAVLSGLMFTSPFLCLVLALLLFLAFTAQRRSVLLILLMYLSSDWNRLRGKTSYWLPADISRAALILSGTAVGFLAQFFFKGARVPTFLLAAILLGCLILLAVKAGKGMTAVGMIMLVTGLALLRDMIPCFADDGGWQEAGNSLIPWITSPGAPEAVVSGITPAMLASGGIILPSAYHGGDELDQLLDNMGHWTNQLLTPVIQTVENLLTPVVGQVVQAFVPPENHLQPLHDSIDQAIVSAIRPPVQLTALEQQYAQALQDSIDHGTPIDPHLMEQLEQEQLNALPHVPPGKPVHGMDTPHISGMITR